MIPLPPRPLHASTAATAGSLGSSSLSHRVQSSAIIGNHRPHMIADDRHPWQPRRSARVAPARLWQFLCTDNTVSLSTWRGALDALEQCGLSHPQA